MTKRIGETVASKEKQQADREYRERVVKAAVAERESLKRTLPDGWRAVVVMTDYDGSFVGVASTTYSEDTVNLLRCALHGDGYEVHAGEVATHQGTYDRDLFPGRDGVAK